MSDLREAILAAEHSWLMCRDHGEVAFSRGRHDEPPKCPECGPERVATYVRLDAVLGVVEQRIASERERADGAKSALKGSHAIGYREGYLEAQAQARQRIEALPGVITGMEYVHGVREGNSAIVMRADVLEALEGN